MPSNSLVSLDAAINTFGQNDSPFLGHHENGEAFDTQPPSDHIIKPLTHKDFRKLLARLEAGESVTPEGVIPFLVNYYPGFNQLTQFIIDQKGVRNTEAQLSAFQWLITNWINTNRPEITNSNQCAACGEYINPKHNDWVILADGATIHLRPQQNHLCWNQWQAIRHREAILAIVTKIKNRPKKNRHFF